MSSPVSHITLEGLISLARRDEIPFDSTVEFLAQLPLEDAVGFTLGMHLMECTNVEEARSRYKEAKEDYDKNKKARTEYDTSKHRRRLSRERMVMLGDELVAARELDLAVELYREARGIDPEYTWPGVEFEVYLADDDDHRPSGRVQNGSHNSRTRSTTVHHSGPGDEGGHDPFEG
ncbi:hypothetical protein D9611_014938 [Ephemerocybe angulata]|uniref:Uncharacterized protein n=1 Tax=Ephemerocybe angulata TaxID=980116 RepID=A0A8H5F8Z1_9AGAR|nr:hypothetical protein D9611_014938 [Tulosesus angulatus]